MKNILVIGENSYIGKSFKEFATEKYRITMADSRNGAWKNVDFSVYDSVLHCAGIAHIPQNKKMECLYYKVNCDLAIDVAGKAKRAGVKQFIFISSMAVYGENYTEIDTNTIPCPDKNNFYSASKWKAEQELIKISDDNFMLCIVRPPMVYGKGCKGNFQKLITLIKFIPIFPKFPNKRSMIYIDNLSNFFCMLIDNESKGLFLPQNKEYVNTTHLMLLIAKYSKRFILLISWLNPLIKTLVKNRFFVINKIFGDLYYLAKGDEIKYETVNFEDSIRNSII